MPQVYSAEKKTSPLSAYCDLPSAYSYPTLTPTYLSQTSDANQNSPRLHTYSYGLASESSQPHLSPAQPPYPYSLIPGRTPMNPYPMGAENVAPYSAGFQPPTGYPYYPYYNIPGSPSAIPGFGSLQPNTPQSPSVLQAHYPHAVTSEVIPAPPAVQSSFITFDFSEKTFAGPVVDPGGKIVYKLQTEESTFSTKPTKVTRADGKPVGELAWRGFTHHEKITLNGKTYEKKELMKRKHNLGSSSNWSFSDDAGCEYTWFGLELHDPEGKVVAKYKRAIEATEQKASLTVSIAHLYMLDILLFTALWLEARRNEKQAENELVDIVEQVGNQMS